MLTVSRSICALILATACGQVASAADLYMTPEGAGKKDGSAWSEALAYNAAPTSLQEAWDRLAAGETCHLGIGEYAVQPVTLHADGKDAAGMRSLRGEVRDGKHTVFTGTWGKNDKAKGVTLFTIATGATWWTIADLEVRNCMIVVETQAPGQVAHGRLSNLALEEVRDGFVIDGGATATKPESGSHDIAFSDCSVVHYTKRGFRFRDGCWDITLDRCLADAGGKEWATEAFHMGYAIAGGEAGSGVSDHDFTFTSCIARNNYWDAGEDKYWQGDGFCTERNVYNLTFIGCGAFDNGDGGWDSKAANPLLIGCVALRNKKNFRFWSDDPGVLLVRCVGAYALKRGGNSEATGIWIGGKARATQCSFVGNDVSVAINDFHETSESRARQAVDFQACIITATVEQQQGLLAFPTAKFADSVFWNSAAQPDEALGYTASTEAKALSEITTQFDSRGHGRAVGYASTWRTENLLAAARQRQPLLPTIGKLLPAAPLTVFSGKRPINWYLSGWKNATIDEQPGAGPEGRTVLAISATGEGGVAYQTKRTGIVLTDHEPTAWALCFGIKNAAPGMQIKALSAGNENATRDLPLRADAGATGWQEVSMPLNGFLVDPASSFAAFAGFTVRVGHGKTAQPILIDRVRLEPVH